MSNKAKNKSNGRIGKHFTKGRRKATVSSNTPKSKRYSQGRRMKLLGVSEQDSWSMIDWVRSNFPNTPYYSDGSSEKVRFVVHPSKMKEGYLNMCFVGYEDFDETFNTTMYLLLESNFSLSGLCLKNIDPVIKSPELLEHIIDHKIMIFHYDNLENTKLLGNLLLASQEISEQRALVKRDRALNASKALQSKTTNIAIELKETLEEIESEGKLPLRVIAQELTDRNIETPSKGKVWNAMTVKRIKDRISKMDSNL